MLVSTASFMTCVTDCIKIGSSEYGRHFSKILVAYLETNHHNM